MPSTSKKQHNFMAAVAHNPSFAKKVGVPQSVGKDFNQADKGKKFKEGGAMKPVDMKKNPGLAKLPTSVRNKMGYMKKGGMAKVQKYAEGDMVEDDSAYVGSRLNMGKDRGSRLGRVSKEDSDMLKKQDAETGMNKNPRMGGLARAGMSAGLGDKRAAYGGFKKGGVADAKADMKMDKSQDKAMIKKAFKQHDMQEHKGGKGTSLKLAKGGSFRSSADGCATKGKTKGTQIKMNKGGAC
jgi:hypothetical protein